METCYGAQVRYVEHHLTQPFSAKDVDGKGILGNGATSRMNRDSMPPDIGRLTGKASHLCQGKMGNSEEQGET
jgi:hypothetical protein